MRPLAKVALVGAGYIGALALASAVVAVSVVATSGLWYLVPLLAVSWLPYVILKYSRRYRRAERRASEAELARPHYVISLAPTRQDELRGGYVRV